jgi:glycosyltransferase involved in cell wall biosynthesis
MPAYEAQETISQAVASALAQSVGEIELLVVDDGSRVPAESALASVSDERLRIVRLQRKGGVSAARNAALAIASAPLIAQLDADDYWRADHLEHLLGAFDDADVGLAYANAALIGAGAPSALALMDRTPGDGLPNWIPDRARQPVDDLNALYAQNPIVASAAVMRTAAVRACGGYPEWLRVGEEYMVYIRLRRAGWRFAYVDFASAVYRWPEPRRGVTYDAKRNARELTKLFGVLALTSPPRAAIFARLGSELLALLRAYVPVTVAAKRLLRSAGASLRGRTRFDL